MRRIIVDSGSSIKQKEKDAYEVDILPVRLEIGGEEYLDDVNLDSEELFEKIEATKEFAKTAMPSLEQAQQLVEKYTDAGDEVLIITISSEISGTFQTLTSLFSDNDKVRVFDSRMAVGGIRFLVQEAHKYENESMDFVVEKLTQLIPRVVIMAIPESLDYLLYGGRLSRASWMVGKILSIKPIIGFLNGKVTVLCKKRGLRAGMQYILDSLDKMKCDPEYGIVASYTHDRANLDELMRLSSPEVRGYVSAYDRLTACMACHWGPNAFGYIYVRKEEDPS